MGAWSSSPTASTYADGQAKEGDACRARPLVRCATAFDDLLSKDIAQSRHDD